MSVYVPAARVKMTVASAPGVGTISLGTNVLDATNGDYQTFLQAGVADQSTVSYCLQDGHNWEIGRGLYSQTPQTLTRVVTQSNNSGSPINATSAAVVFITPIAGDISGTPQQYIIAAHDSSAKAQQSADFVCTGSSDDVLINSVITSMTNGGTLLFLTGTYLLSSAIVIDHDWITLRGEGNQHWGSYQTYFGNTTQQSYTGAPGGAKLVQTGSSANGITIDKTLANMHGWFQGNTGDTRHKGISIEKLYLSGPGDQPFLYNVVFSGTPGSGTYTLTVTDSSVVGSPVSVPATVSTNVATAASALATAINGTAALTNAGISATANVVASGTCQIQTLTSLIPLPTFATGSNTSSFTVTLSAAANPSYGTGTGISDAFSSTSPGQEGFSDVCRITECSIIGFDNGIEVGWDSGHICGNNLQNLNGFGIKLEGINTFCNNNLIFDIHGPGIWVNPEIANEGGHMITNNLIGDIGGDVGIALGNTVTPLFTKDNVVSNNFLNGCHLGCILIGAGTNNVITGNVCEKTGTQPSNSGPGILIGFSTNACNNNLVTSNSFNETATSVDYAVSVGNTQSSGNLISYNALTGTWNGSGQNINPNSGGNLVFFNTGQIPSTFTANNASGNTPAFTASSLPAGVAANSAGFLLFTDNANHLIYVPYWHA